MDNKEKKISYSSVDIEKNPSSADTDELYESDGGEK